MSGCRWEKQQNVMVDAKAAITRIPEHRLLYSLFSAV